METKPSKTMSQKVAEFAEACDRAFCDLFITWDERNAAVKKYERELLEASDAGIV